MAAASTHYERVETVDRNRRLRRAAAIARLMDTALEIPFTRIRFGADSILGLAPGIGDAAGALIGLFIVNEARRLGLPNDKLLRMVVNVGVDAFGGSVPIVGDLFDVYFKSNKLNVDIMLDHFATTREELARTRRS